MSQRAHLRVAGGLLAAFCTAGCGPPDYESFEDYTEQLEQRFEQTQDCHSLLEMPASMMDGRAYRAAPVEFGAGGKYAFVTYTWTSDGGVYFGLDGYDGMVRAAPPCSPDLYNYVGELASSGMPPDTSRVFARGFTVPDTAAPFLAEAVSQDRTNSTLDHGWGGVPIAGLEYGLSGSATGQLAWSGFYGGAWVCTESYTGPVGTHYAPPDWTGVMFIHAELWELPDGSLRYGGTTLSREYGGVSLPLDVIVHLEDVDCARSEDAADPSTLDHYCYNWTADCDGIDNDLDGEIDEGVGVDRDGNGVADCMDDWDHDGIPNREDDDLRGRKCDI